MSRVDGGFSRERRAHIRAPRLSRLVVLLGVGWLGAIGLTLGMELAVALTIFPVGLALLEASGRVVLKLALLMRAPPESASLPDGDEAPLEDPESVPAAR